jgi:tetratricopeptide (TPR) repeat protein
LICFQDVLSDFDLRTRQQYLRAARDKVDAAIKSDPSDSVAAALSARKSSVLRYLGLTEVTPENRLHRLEEAQRCATRAVALQRANFTVLELGIAEWTLARHERTDDRYASRLRNAEAYLSEAAADNFEAARFALTRFYRLTFQPLRACETFPLASDELTNIRSVFRDAYIFGEAAAHLWFANYPSEAVERFVKEAKALLETAVAAGFRTARNVVALAYVTAVAQGEEAGSTALAEICTKDGIAWDRALRIAANADSSRLLDFGFALGIDQSPVWTRLGTYVWRFRKDSELAEALYRTAIRLDPHDAIAITNLARFLIRRGKEQDLQEARRLLQKAQNFADRRFTWWRTVISLLPTRTPPPTGKLPAPAAARMRFENLTELRDEFRRVEHLLDVQQRGYELERIIYELAKLTVGIASAPYRITREGRSISQIDGYFEVGPDKYRVECKWEATPSGPSDIVLFADKLDVVGVAGLFISMAGFTEQAIGRAREMRQQKAIILMDGDEVRWLFQLQINFDILLMRKRLHFNQRSEPYHKTSLVAEAE